MLQFMGLQRVGHNLVTELDCSPPGSFVQEYYSGLSFPSPGDLPDPAIEPESPALAGGFFTTEPS